MTMKNTIRRGGAGSGQRGQSPRARGKAGAHAQAGWGETWRQMRVWLLVLALSTFMLVLGVAQAFSATGPRTGYAPEQISGNFGPCGPRADTLCVVDGDTFRINERRVRVVGIDTAERHARCDAEAALAARSTLALQQWLNRGPFTMTPNPARAIDRYGRELQIVARMAADGSVDALADWMQAEGGAREYGGGARSGWC